jgi:nitrate reductase gamma subunit
MFNLLNISAILVLVGLVLAGWRRLTDPGERATQTFYEDIMPLLLIPPRSPRRGSHSR